jgi:hypothetical protein
MNTALFEQRNSTITMNDPDQPHRHQLLPPSAGVVVRQKKSYLTNRTRSNKKENSTSVKDSLSKFLADTELQDDDMMDLFKATTNSKNTDKNNNNNNIGSTSINDITNTNSDGDDDKNNKNTNINTNDKTDNNKGDDNNTNNDTQEFLFDRKALLKASENPSSREKLRSRSRRPNGKKDIADRIADRKKKTAEREKERRRSSPKTPKKKKVNKSSSYESTSSDSNDEDIDIDIDAETFAGDCEDEISISSSESKKKKKKKKKNSTSERNERIGRRSSMSHSKNNDRGSRLRSSRSISRVRTTTPRSSRSLSRARAPPSTSRSTPSRTHSLKNGTSSGSRAPRRTRSDSSCSSSSKNGTNKSLSMGLEGLNKQVRRESIKEQYRSPSVDPRNRQQDYDNDDGGGSVASGMSYRSTLTTRSSYKPSGLEGGALNAFMGNTHIAQNATTSRGRSIVTPTGGNCSVFSEPADENYIKERKARQDLIMDVALKEKWRHEAEATKEAEMLEKEKFDSNYYSSDEDIGTKKKKGLIKKMKKAARKTARASRSGAKGAANVVKDPKRAGKRVGKVAKGVGKETAKMVMDPSLAAKRGTQGFIDTVNLTANVATNVAKEGFDVTSSLTKQGIKGAAMVVDGTIDGAGRFVQGATDILFMNDDQEDSEDDYDDYDPRSLSTSEDRQVCKKTFAERMSTSYDDTDVNRKLGKEFDSNRSEIRSPKIITALEIKTAPSKASKKWWDI